MQTLRNRASFAAVLAALSVAAAHAQAPTPPDYAAAATAFYEGIMPLITTVLPVAALILVLFMGPKVLKRLIKSFSG